MDIDLKARIESSVVAFRGYNVTNQGKSLKLLNHPRYGPLVERQLNEASEICSETTGKKTDLVAALRGREPSTLETFARDIALVVCMEVAQVRLLEEFHGVSIVSSRMSFGYSVGEMAALVCGGCYRLGDILPLLLSLAKDCAELAHDVTMGVVFSRGRELDLANVRRLCQQVNRQGQGVVAMSAQLSPNTVLILGQGNTVDAFRDSMAEVLGENVQLRKNRNHWPPLHSPLLWERNISNRAGLMMHTVPIQAPTPTPNVFSLATGGLDYNDYNSADILCRWIDHPQLLWEAIYATLAAGVDTVIHVGPEPNLIPATFRRISENVKAQTRGNSPKSLGLRAVTTIWRPWLAKWLSKQSALLRAPFIEPVILEDWLLEQESS